MSTTFDIDSTIVDVSVVVPYEVTATASVVLPVVYEAQESVPPTIDNVEILEVGTNSIEISFDVDRQGATECVKGVLWGTTNPPTFSGGDYRLQYGDGNIDLDIAGLLINTTYYLRPYALSNLGYTYGDVVEQATGTSPIPDEYQLVEYLESTGTQYINTGVVGNQNQEYIIDFFDGLHTSSESILFMATSSNPGWGSHNIGINFHNASTNVYCYFNYDGATGLYPIHSGIFKLNSIGLYLNDNLIYTRQSIAQFSTTVPIYLFAKNTNGTLMYPSAFKVRYFTISESGTFIRKMYPVYRKSDSVAGMYDIVNNVFYTNQGSGTFIVGADKEWEDEE